MMRGLMVFVLWSLVEISLFVTIGARIGVIGTLAVVIGSAVLGVAILRRLGDQAFTALRSNVVLVRAPMTPVAHSGLLALAALLLILPGFLTDAVGLLMLLPPVRRWIIARVGTRLKAATSDGGATMRYPPAQDVIEATAVKRNEPSGWTKP